MGVDLDAIEARANAASAAPWIVGDTGWRVYGGTEMGESEREQRRATTRFTFDAEFVAHAREDVPALVAAIREKDEYLAEIRDCIAMAEGATGEAAVTRELRRAYDATVRALGVSS